MAANQSTELAEFGCTFHWDSSLIRGRLSETAGDFLKFRDDAASEIWAAGRDWFLEPWGRDTFIALPGLLLATGEFTRSASIFRNFARQITGGLIPNRVRGGTVEYNTADASMWYLWALRRHVSCSGDHDLLLELMPAVVAIVAGYRDGTGFHRGGAWHSLTMDDDGLIVSPPQATWMDADPSGEGHEVVTPRNGKTVEINALWYTHLRWLAGTEPGGAGDLMRVLAGAVPKDFVTFDWARLADRVQASFNARFWDGDSGRLSDVVDGDPDGHAMRPNQLIAVSHGDDLLSSSRQRRVLDAVTRDLLTPGGLRTLSPGHPNYRGVYVTEAPMSEKDYAYHQGTVWPWLMGPYGDAVMKLGGQRHDLRDLLTPLVRFAMESEYRSLPEVFSGDPPHDPGGTRSQAWSVSEVLRLIVEYEL